MFVNLFYKRFGDKDTKRFYWYFRIDYLGKCKFQVIFTKHENINWDLNILLKEIIESF